MREERATHGRAGSPRKPYLAGSAESLMTPCICIAAPLDVSRYRVEPRHASQHETRYIRSLDGPGAHHPAPDVGRRHGLHALGRMLGRSKYSIRSEIETLKLGPRGGPQGLPEPPPGRVVLTRAKPQPLRPGARTLPPLPSEMHADER